MKLINKIEEALDKVSDTYDKSLLYVIDRTIKENIKHIEVSFEQDGILLLNASLKQIEENNNYTAASMFAHSIIEEKLMVIRRDKTANPRIDKWAYSLDILDVT